MNNNSSTSSFENTWPQNIVQVSIPSSGDKSEQPAMAFFAKNQQKIRPLLVGLHTWSTDFLLPAHGKTYAQWAIQEDWNFIYPNFRGPNCTPESMGSHLAIQDVVNAVDFMKNKAKINPNRIYLIGGSGGGHMALLMGGRHPEIWAGISAWVPIFDISAWYDEHSLHGELDGYAKQIEQVLGRPMNAVRREEARRRSPISCLSNAEHVPVDIHHGIHDGRKGSVPFRHSLYAFNALAKPEDQLPHSEIDFYYNTQKLPQGWAAASPDKLYGKNHVLFRKTSKNVRITIFEGGHHLIPLQGLNWLSRQKKGTQANWDVKRIKKFRTETTEVSR